MQHLNLGGGFAIPDLRGAAHAPQDELFLAEADPDAVAEVVVPAIQAALGQQVELLFEPGRSLVGEAAVLLARVEGAKHRAGRDWLILDAGYNVLIESLANKWYYHAVTANRLDESGQAAFRLVGPLCDSGDAFHDVEGEALLQSLLAAGTALAGQRAVLEKALLRLPPERRLAAGTGVGDLIAFLDVGAYSYDQLTANNGRLRPEVGLLGPDGGYELMRRRDSLPDLLFNELL
ncbi:Pyridoxal-dependent decarboxylase, C-terminal sheet domain [Tistlia consotensis]|uniref:Diaminopimelate decarboxylase n=1 Tax=Tistlia consotensis USBA 355 TaxID=560819 RepID=A0A1Y6CDP7_9PROT|nr:diaminopimelate decarboxylase [Tistlia consotensis USBA 355]SNR63315.1 Pyridoxal-dependent decarboxylase, C-terminal sheet domain [Tistlia consotensis]